MKKLFTILALGIGCLSFLPSSNAYAQGSPKFLALCYHNIEDKDPDQSFNGITTSKFIDQMTWLQHEGYKAVSVNDLIAAQEGKKPLPEKAVLLTFDDGYESFYTRAYPILKAFHFPAVIALVDEWMEDGAGKNGNPGDTKVMYGNTYLARSFFLTWPQVREMVNSGLVEVASHSDALHTGIMANPQGNTEPSATTELYDSSAGGYESRTAYVARLQKDAEKSVKTIEGKLGRKPRVMVWPYGTFNDIGLAVQKNQGMAITMSLEDGFAAVDNLRHIPRQLINHDPALTDFVSDFRDIDKMIPMRVVQVDLDYIYDADPGQLARNLDLLINRIHDLQINAVFLQAFSDPLGSGLAHQLYFPNRHLPVRANLFNRVTWQLKTRAHVKVYGWLPVFSFDLGQNINTVKAFDPVTKTSSSDDKAYHRVSVFDEAGKNEILEIYEDMARNAPIDGLLFHDDAVLSDFEDASTPALGAYQQAGFPVDIAAIRANPDILRKWTAFKTDALIGFTNALTNRVRQFRNPIKTARNIYAPAVLNQESEAWFAQNYDRFLVTYDYTAIEAMPKMENIPNSEATEWLEKLIASASRRPNGLAKTIFELQSVDWRKQDQGQDRAIPSDELSEQMRLLVREGALNFGYYPDDFVTNTPQVETIHKDFSLQSYPYQP